MKNLKIALQNLRSYIEKEEFKGYDPYDTLNSWIPFHKLGKWIPIFAIQFQKRNPLNIRPLLGIKKDYNPKAMGLLLHAYSLLYKKKPQPETKQKMDFLFRWLLNNPSPGYNGYAWGYNFHWASPAKMLPAYTASVVVTGFVGRGIFNYYKASGDDTAVSILENACRFVTENLPRTETSDGICFSYTPVMTDCCYNASMLGAELLAALYSITKEEKLLNLIKPAVDFVVHRQKQNGAWYYSIDPQTSRERKQIDFHQGFILDSLLNVFSRCDLQDDKYLQALKKGAEFYFREQFFQNGRSKWRLPATFPVDIHNQAQGILTFSRLGFLSEKYPAFARTIADWTIQNMQHETGYFYYRIGKYFKNKISYLRWGQVWMFLALVSLLSSSKGDE